MYYYRRSYSIFDTFTLSPLPYPVLLILAVISILLAISWFFNYEEMVESVGAQLNWLLLVVPLVLIVIVRWLSSMENPDKFFAMSPWDKRWKTYYYRQPEGASPWGVAALIVLLLVLMQFRSFFLDRWSI